MTPTEPACPVCDADLVLSGDERDGEQVFCSYCGAPSLLALPSPDAQAWEVEEDF